MTILGFFGASVTAMSFGSGVTVNSFSMVNRTQINANITIAATAVAGDRDVSVTTNGVTVVGGKLFTVVTVELHPNLYEGFRVGIFEDIQDGELRSVFWRNDGGMLVLYTGPGRDISGIGFRAEVKLTGGGVDGTKGIDKVRVRFLQHVTSVPGCFDYNPNPDKIPTLKLDAAFPLVDRAPGGHPPPFPFFNGQLYVGQFRISSETEVVRTLDVGDSLGTQTFFQLEDSRVLVATPLTSTFTIYVVYYVDSVPTQIISRAGLNWAVSYNGTVDSQNQTWTPNGAGIVAGPPYLTRTEPKKVGPVANDAVEFIDGNCP